MIRKGLHGVYELADRGVKVLQPRCRRHSDTPVALAGSSGLFCPQPWPWFRV